ncbi:MAG: hypothetical protein ICV60_15320 [Pyrinomonadaceae bacterium]|nr:hypothetical protein [Pyrinomonadaceae bacterium]
MSYRVTRSDGRPIVELEDEPPYCRALRAAPPAREPELNTGLWLVMVFAAWSIYDIRAIQVALDAARRFDGKIKLGLRPFYASEEHAAWCPDLKEDDGNPLWIVLRDGEMCMKRHGFPTVDELAEEIKAACLA